MESPAAEPDARPHYDLSEEQIEELVQHLKAGRRLPPSLFPYLFETARECQLTYAGKARRSDVLADTMAVPLQPARQVGSADVDWAHMLVMGDNLQVLRQLLHLKSEGELRNADGTPGVRFCYLDPPFGTGRDFSDSKAQRAYEDKVQDAEFIEFLRRRLIIVHELLADNGVLAVHLDSRKSHYIKVVLDEVFGPSHFLNEVIWSYRRWPTPTPAFQKMHDTILIYRKGSYSIFHQEYEAASDSYLKRFKGASQRLDAETGTRKIKTEEQTKGLRMRDVWEMSVVAPNSPERRASSGYPTQKPRALIQRFISTMTNPGDLVLDAFGGSGTTAVAAQNAEGGSRRWVLIDSGKLAIYATQRRLLRIANEIAGAEPEPFTLYNAGLYDFAAVRNLPWPGYEQFALQLFQARRNPRSISGVTFQGRIGDSPVLVYDYTEHLDAVIGYEYIRDLRGLCGDALGERVFLIAPALCFEPYEDYVDVDGTRFYLLRIPYSIIAELHKRSFAEMRQPRSLDSANSIVEAVGFDFIQPPKVIVRHALDAEGNAYLQIVGFISSPAVDTQRVVGLDALSMVLVDCDYDGDVVDLDVVAFGDDVTGAGGVLTLPTVGQRVMIIYVDVYGNEFREVKAASDFRPSQARSDAAAPRKQAVKRAAAK